MNKTRCILLTGAGGTALPFLIKLLKSKGHRVLAADMDSCAVGLYLADKGFVIPAGNSDDFLPVIRDICRYEKVDVFIPLVDEELEKAVDLNDDGIHVIAPQKDFIKICLDKYLLSSVLKKFNIPQPQTFLLSEFEHQISFPFIIKPRVGRGSRGFCVIESIDQLKRYRQVYSYVPEQLIVQEYIRGVEYTVSVVVWRDGIIRAIVPKEIISKKGVTKMAITRHNNLIDDVCHVIQDNLHANGPFNVQLKLDVDGIPKIFEINPRFSTSTTLTIAAGIDEFNLLIDCCMTKNFDLEKLTWKEGVVLVRQTEDTFFSGKEFISKKESITRCTR